jgi:hypothetical protein
MLAVVNIHQYEQEEQCELWASVEELGRGDLVEI